MHHQILDGEDNNPIFINWPFIPDEENVDRGNRRISLNEGPPPDNIGITEGFHALSRPTACLYVHAGLFRQDRPLPHSFVF